MGACEVAQEYRQPEGWSSTGNAAEDAGQMEAAHPVALVSVVGVPVTWAKDNGVVERSPTEDVDEDGGSMAAVMPKALV